MRISWQPLRARASPRSNSQKRTPRVEDQEPHNRRKGRCLVLMMCSMKNQFPKNRVENLRTRVSLSHKRMIKLLTWPIRRRSQKIHNMKSRSLRLHLSKSKNLRNMRSPNFRRNHLNSNMMTITKSWLKSSLRKSQRSQRSTNPNCNHLNQNLIKISLNFWTKTKTS